MKTIAIYRHKPEVGIGICRHIGFDDNNDFLFSHELFAEDDEEEKGFSVRKVDVENIQRPSRVAHAGSGSYKSFEIVMG